MLYTPETLPHEVELGELLTVCTVSAANIVKDVRENLRNLVGGEMKHYEALIEKTLERALKKLEAKAAVGGYDGVLGVKIANPKVVEGGVEIIVYGNGFHYK
ncbi:MAG: hypothetical protein AVDCRST_MAG86-4378 [uncultured Truepera sp.]|uniref:Heavy metal-binding domain-containing protein n=1 Tax=uncultured Truepera sp. TaxID=543023 RepID=A0A6J4VWK7_9DEIN|nr:MAG: hypothetical protein AVDCRST_MAG86-4378 [uncultured Truepera sp.]